LIKKRQIVAIVSIAVVSFLVGTMFNVTVATDGGNPFDSLWEVLCGLESRIEALEEQSLPQGFVTAPAYDSGWVTIEPDETLTLSHNLNTTEVFVYLIGKWGYNAKIHQRAYGSVDSWGAFWYDLDSKRIRVNRRTNDGTWDYIRVMIWRLPEPLT